MRFQASAHDHRVDQVRFHIAGGGLFRLALVLASVLFGVGCGSDLAQVSGLVTLDGQPLKGADGVHATVSFQPTTAGGAVAVGLVDADGTYRLSSGSQAGITPGEYIVCCSASQIIPSATPGGTPSGKRLTDPKYASAKTSEFRFNVQLGENQFDIPLKSPAERAAWQ